MKKIFVTGLAFVLAIVASITGTLAWLSAQTEAVTNTFTVGDINITLIEHKYNADDLDETTAETTTNQSYKLIPGNVYAKDPVVTVKANSEKCYLFVKFEETNNASKYLTYTSLLKSEKNSEGKEIGWTELTTGSGIWYKVVESSTTDQSWHLLESDKVTVNNSIVKRPKDASGNYVAGETDENGKYYMPTAGSEPSLKYTAYAIQFDNMTSADDAWSKISTAVATGEYNEAE